MKMSPARWLVINALCFSLGIALATADGAWAMAGALFATMPIVATLRAMFRRPGKD